MIIRAFAIALLLLLGAGGFHYLLDAEQQEARRQASRHLASVASLKVDQLTGWRGERLSDAIVLMHNPGFADDRAIARLMQGVAQARAAIAPWSWTLRVQPWVDLLTRLARRR